MRNGKFGSRRRLSIRQVLVAMAAVLALMLLPGTAFARNTYVITDGNRVFTYESFATDPAEVLSEAGLDLDAYDTFTTEASNGTTALTVRRSQSISIDWYGETLTAESYGETVGQLLARLNLYPGEGDVLSHAKDTPTADGMRIRVENILRQEQSYTARLPYATSYCYDDSLPEGEETVLVAGKDGQMRCTALVTYVNGVETAREVTGQTVTVNPVEEIIAVGTGKGPAEEEQAAGLVIGENTITLATGEVLTYTHTAQVRATAYNHNDAGCDMITATGTTVHMGTVAVDPRYIPYGTRMFIVSNDGVYEYGISVAEDCGGAIKGDRVDLYFPTYSECMAFGRRNCTIYFLG